MTSKDEMAGAGPDNGPALGHRPTVSHQRDPLVCTRCNTGPRKDGSVWCKPCIEQGKARARASVIRQIKAGRPVSEENWKPGDPFWWKASGCYGKP